MYLLGYRGEEVIHADTTTVNVVNDRDILGRNWTDERQLGHNVGYNDVLGVNDDFTTYAVDYAGVPTVNFYFRVSVDMEPDAMNKLNYSRFKGYINSLMGKPVYSTEYGTLNEVY